MNYKIFLKNFLSESELLKINYKNLSDDEILDLLIDEKIIFLCDWKGEDDEYDLLKFFSSRVLMLTEKQLSVNKDELYKKFEKQSKDEFMPFALKYFDKELKKIDLAVAVFNMGNDTYHLSVTTVTAIKKLNKLKNDFWKVESVRKHFANPGFIYPYEFFTYYTNECENCGGLMVMSRDTKHKKNYYLCSSCNKQQSFNALEGKGYTIKIPTSISEYGKEPFTKIYVDNTIEILIRLKPLFRSEEVETCEQIISDLFEMTKGESVK